MAPQLQRGFYRVNEQGRPEQQPPSEWTATVDDELPTLAEVFARVPQHVGFDIEVCAGLLISASAGVAASWHC